VEGEGRARGSGWEDLDSLMVILMCVGNMDSNLFEDTCREMFGVHAYISFTMDKLIQYFIRQVSRSLSICAYICGAFGGQTDRQTDRQTDGQIASLQ
jgi:hypothetical protein